MVVVGLSCVSTGFLFMQGIFIIHLKYKQCRTFTMCHAHTHGQRSRVFADTYITRDNRTRDAGNLSKLGSTPVQALKLDRFI